MIRYALACDKSHDFESWFQNSTAYDEQAARGLVTCPLCGSAKVGKALMTPRLGAAAKKGKMVETPVEATPPAAAASAGPANGPVSAPAVMPPAPVAMMSPQEQEIRAKLKELREHLTKNADNVGRKFIDEARKMHYGEIEHRSIYGEASADEARELIEEGIEVHPLPVLPDERN